MYYEELVDVAFLILVRKLTKLLANKAKQVDDLKTYLEQRLRSRDGCSVDRKGLSHEDSTLIGCKTRLCMIIMLNSC